MSEQKSQPAVQLAELTVAIGDRTLLSETSAEFEAGKITLIIGPSGAGKSVLLKVLSGAVASDSPIDVHGKVRFGDQDVVVGGRRPPVGIVFQYFSLFDEFSAVDNVRFAEDHSAKNTSEKNNGTDLLKELQVPQSTPVSLMSGGQQQRLAIARTLAYDPDVIFYDEPTSGLDAATAQRVAGLIADTQKSHQKTSIIVTHDYESLPKIADAVYLLDANKQQLREIPKTDWDKLEQILQQEASPAPSESTQSSNLARRASTLAADFLVTTSNVLTATTILPLNLFPMWKSLRWGLRYFWHYFKLIAGPSACLYIAIAGIIIGFVTTHFTFRFLPYSQYTEPLIIEDLLRSIGFALYRILVPVLTTILIAARCGAAVASDIGGKTYGRQIDAIATFGVTPQRYLLTGSLYAFLLGTPILVAVGFWLAKITSMVVFTITHANRGPEFWEWHFHSRLIEPDSSVYVGTAWLLAKVLVCAIGIGMIAYHQGARPKSSTNDVSHSITASILWGTLFVLVVHFFFTFLEFKVV